MTFKTMTAGSRVCTDGRRNRLTNGVSNYKNQMDIMISYPDDIYPKHLLINFTVIFINYYQGSKGNKIEEHIADSGSNGVNLRKLYINKVKRCAYCRD